MCIYIYIYIYKHIDDVHEGVARHGSDLIKGPDGLMAMLGGVPPPPGAPQLLSLGAQ